MSTQIQNQNYTSNYDSINTESFKTVFAEVTYETFDGQHSYHKTYNMEQGISLTGLHIADAGNLALRHSAHARNLANSNSF